MPQYRQRFCTIDSGLADSNTITHFGTGKHSVALAVGRYAGEDVELDAEAFEEHGFRTSFKVAVASLTDELSTIIGGDILSLGVLSLGMEEDKVWWTTGRMGTFTITSDS